MQTIRLVRRNLGTGGCDFYTVERREWFWPFWIRDSWSLDFATMKCRFDNLVSKPEPSFTILETN